MPASGTALRAQGYIDGFSALGHEVVISVPHAAIDSSEQFGVGGADLESWRELAFCHRTQNSIVSRVRPDLILCGHWPAVLFSTKPSVPLVLDLAGPHLLERHFQGAGKFDSALIAKLNAIAMADLYIVSGPSQRLYFLSFLMRTKVEQPEERIVEIPMLYGTPPSARPARQISTDYPRIIFAGVFLPWQDPSDALRKAVEVLKRRGTGRLILVGGPHPSYEIGHGVYKDLFRELSNSRVVEVHEMLPLAEFNNLLASADVALDLMKWNLERELAVTIRTTSYLHSGLPVIYNNFADLGRIIEEHQAGWAVEPHQLEDVINFIVDNPTEIFRRSENASRLAAKSYNAESHCSILLARAGTRSGSREELDITLDFPQRNDLAVRRDYPISQRFTSRINGLAEVRIKLQPDTESGSTQIRLSLNEESSELAIASQSFSIDSSMSGDWIRLKFEPIHDSAGKTFRLVLEGDMIYPWFVEDSPYPLLGVTAMGETFADRALCMQTIALG